MIAGGVSLLALTLLATMNVALRIFQVPVSGTYEVVSFAVVMNREKWDSLPADVKDVLEQMRREQAEWTGKYVDDHVTEALAWSKAEYQHQLFELSAADQDKVASLLKPMTDEYVKKTAALGLPAGQIVADTLALKKKYERKYR